MQYTVSDIVEFIFFIEKKYNLLNYKIKGIYFWKIVRFNIFSKIAQITKVYDEAHPQKMQKKDFKYYIKRIKEEQKIIKFNALKGDYKKDILIFEHTRNTEIEGKNIDIYTYYIANELKNKKLDYECLQLKLLDKFTTIDNLRLAIIPFSKMYKKNISFHTEEINLLQKIEEEILKKFHVNVDVTFIVKKEIRNFINKYRYFDKLIKKRQPKKIYLVCSYGLEALIFAAKSHGVEVIEFQHGTMSRYHMGYSFPNNDYVPYFPDKILLFGKYWKDSTPLPLPEDCLIIYGYPYLDQQIKKYIDKTKIKNNNIVFLSQGTIGERLSYIAYEFAKKNIEYHVFFKLHPSEFKIWKEKYSSLLKASQLSNFQVIDENSKNLYEIFSKCEYQVGVYSTAIYEGIAMGLKTILVDLPGIEYMEYLIKKTIALKIKNEDELSMYIKQNFEFNLCKKDYFFKDTYILQE
ncbi:hypothetical protein [Garciella nitratireducens]|uniref:hypothetical protein n=1 Tax=Garciella nitratireducens TaxID=218205 RepID=UPI001BD2C850|nr:hypothetical protein [Garciella nitratireducens]